MDPKAVVISGREKNIRVYPGKESEGARRNMKVSLMMEYKDGGSHKYETYEVSTIIDTPEEYLLILKEPKDEELIERVQKDIFYMIVE